MTAEQLGPDPVIQRGDVLHCDVGITALRLNTDTQHNAYVLLPGETDAPAGLRKALSNANRLQDILFEEVRAGRSGNEVLGAALAKMRSEGIDGTVYSHPIGMHGHGAGPLIGLWDYQDGVPGRGDHKVIPGMWYSASCRRPARCRSGEGSGCAWPWRKISSSGRTVAPAGPQAPGQVASGTVRVER